MAVMENDIIDKYSHSSEKLLESGVHSSTRALGFIWSGFHNFHGMILFLSLSIDSGNKSADLIKRKNEKKESTANVNEFDILLCGEKSETESNKIYAFVGVKSDLISAEIVHDLSWL